MKAELYSDGIREREEAASAYRVFPSAAAKSLDQWHDLWDGLFTGDPDNGLDWPMEIRSAVSPEAWPKHAFGTANAGCLVLWHRPGLAGRGGHPPAGAYIGPHIPVLGGIGHAHNVKWPTRHPSPSWRNLHQFLPTALDTLNNAWSQVMIACVNPEPGAAGSIDRTANRRAVAPHGRLDSIVAVCRPLAVLACGTPVCDAIDNWANPTGVTIVRVSHPLKWNGHGGVFDGPHMVERLRGALGM
ncbi:MAG: hypothetical protein F4Y26_17755 [Gammaproteobacteria bacterium]|nr:hypothetical protein [Gammaproteobacteria bacterium]